MEFTNPSEIALRLRNAGMTVAQEHVTRILGSTLSGLIPGNESLFTESIFYCESVSLAEYLRHLKGPTPVQQILGKILFDREFFDALYSGVHNPIVGDHRRTRVSRDPEHLDTVSVAYTLPSQPSLLRYCRRYQIPVSVNSDGLASIGLTILAPENTPEGITSLIEQLPAAVSVYHNLLTRFPTCQDYSNALPSFQI